MAKIYYGYTPLSASTTKAADELLAIWKATFGKKFNVYASRKNNRYQIHARRRAWWRVGPLASMHLSGDATVEFSEGIIR